MSTRPSIGRDLLNVPMGEMIRDMAFAIADAQIKLDSNSIEVAQMMGGLKTITSTVGGEEIVTFEDSRVFFGRERVLLSQAIELFNTTTDVSMRTTIFQDIIEPNFPSKIEAVTTIDNKRVIQLSAAPTSSTQDPGNNDVGEYFQHSSNFYTFFATGTTPSAKWPTANPVVKTYRLKSGAEDGNVSIPTRLSMLELGFSPTFYQFVDTIIEVKINISITEERETSGTAKQSQVSQQSTGKFQLFKKPTISKSRAVNVAQVNASYANKFNYSAEGSSLLRTKLTPIPPPAILEERIRDLMEIARETPVNP